MSDVATEIPAKAVETETKPKVARRAPTPMTATQQARPRGFRWGTLFLTLIALGAGAAGGFLVARHRSHAVEAVASVNGTVINKDELFARLQATPVGQQMLPVGPQVLRQMIQEKLLLDYGKQNNALPTEAQVDERFKKLSEQPNFAQLTANRSLDDIKNSLRVAMVQEQLLSKDVKASDADVQAYYKANVDPSYYKANGDPKKPRPRFYTPESATIAVIITATEADSKAALHDLTSGLPFATVVKNRSKDNSKNNNGVIAGLRRGQTRGKAPDLEDAIFALKIGQQTGPRKFAGAWWIIRCMDRTAEKTEPFEKVQEECRQGALLTKGIPKNIKGSTTGFDEYRKKAYIKAFWPQYEAATHF